MTYNTRAALGFDGRRKADRIADIIAAERPDVVALQEVDRKRRRSGGVDQFDLIRKKTSMDGVFATRLVEPDGGEYGMAVLSRFPVSVVKIASLVPGFRYGKKEKVLGLWVAVDIGVRLHVMTTHFVHATSDRRRLVRELAGELWVGAVPADEPFIVCGDLNSTAGSDIVSCLSGVAINATRFNGHAKSVPTWPAPFPLFQIDHLFVSRHFTVLQTASVKNYRSRLASDHLPLSTDVEVQA